MASIRSCTCLNAFKARNNTTCVELVVGASSSFTSKLFGYQQEAPQSGLGSDTEEIDDEGNAATRKPSELHFSRHSNNYTKSVSRQASRGEFAAKVSSIDCFGMILHFNE